ncbi:SOS response-associated peptidase [Thiobacter aerophilum]|uniref:Abasic site processing protein n=1 Tax=Thiobacter aerophilum TaxID=3121275 RepID=A0ABV0EB77_9BURK
MCGRYTLTTPDLAPIGAVLGVTLPAVPVSYNIAPSLPVPIIRVGARGGYELAWVKWGLVPHWAKEPRSEYSTINARAETVSVKPAFRDAFRRRRCLIPADGFYEWQKQGTGKQPWYIHRKDRQPFAFAGLWERWQGGDEALETCAIIVTEANALIRPIHGRMPVILPPETYRAWLDPATPTQTLLPLLAPYSADELTAEPVSARVNNPRNDGPELIRPLDS